MDEDATQACWHVIELQNQLYGRTAMPKVSDMIVSKFLRKEDFDEDRVMTVKTVKLEDMPGDGSQQKWVLYFREDAKGMALNVTTIRVLEQAFGDDSDNWVGKRVMVYVDPNVSFQGRVIGGLRLRVPKNQPKPAAKPEPEPAEEFDDNIPFDQAASTRVSSGHKANPRGAAHVNGDHRKARMYVREIIANAQKRDEDEILTLWDEVKPDQDTAILVWDSIKREYPTEFVLIEKTLKGRHERRIATAG